MGRLIKAFIFMTGVSLAGAVYADSRVNNGGYGVVIDGHIYALDLALRNVQAHPYLSESVTAELPPDAKDILSYHLRDKLKPTAFGIVERKLAEFGGRVSSQNSDLQVYGLVRNMDRYHWLNLPDLACTDVGDDPTPLPNKVQLAYRNTNWVRFCKEFGDLDAADQAALVMHEIVYSYYTDGQPYVSHLIGFLFSQDFEGYSDGAASELKEILQGLNDETLPNDYVITNRVDAMDIYSVNSVDVAQQEIQTRDAGYTQFRGVLEFNLSVEGNLCAGSAEGVAFTSTPLAPFVTRLQLRSLSVLRPYSDLQYACLADGRVRNARIALKIDRTLLGEETYSETYKIPTRVLYAPNEAEVVVTVSLNKTNGFMTVVH